MFKTTIIILLVINICLWCEPDGMGTFTGNFKGGLNSADPMQIATSEANEMKNYRLSNRGVLSSRLGWRRKALITDEPIILNMVEHKYGQNRQTIVSGQLDEDTITLYGLNSDTTYFEISLPEKRTLYENYKNTFWQQSDILYFGDGEDSNIKYNNVDTTTFYLAGLDAPTQLPTLQDTSSTGNIDTSTYWYRYIFVSDTDDWNFVVSNPYKISLRVIMSISGSCTIANLQVSSHPLVTHKYIYRTEKTLDPTFENKLYYYVGKITNSETVFYDNINDTQLGESSLDLYENYPLPAGNKGIDYRGRQFIAGNRLDPYKVYFSGRSKKPERFIPNAETYNAIYNWYDFSSYGKVTGLALVNGNVIIFTKYTTWFLYIPDITNTTNWVIKNVSLNVGCISHLGIAYVEDAIIFPSENGVYTLGVRLTGDVGTDPDFGFVGEKVKDLYREEIRENDDVIVGIFVNNTYRLSYPKIQTYNNTELIFDNVYKIWTKNDGYNANCYLYTDDRELFAGSSYPNGLIMQLESGNYDGIDGYTNVIDTYTINGLGGEDTIWFKSDDLDTLTLNESIGQTFYYNTSDSFDFQKTPIIRNDTNYVVVPSGVALVADTDDVRAGYINRLRRSGWIFGSNVGSGWTKANDFLNVKRTRYLILESSAYSGDLDISVYIDDIDNKVDINSDVSSAGDEIGIDFEIGESRIGEIAGTSRKSLSMEPYTNFNKFMIQFQSLSDDNLDLHYYTMVYERLRTSSP